MNSLDKRFVLGAALGLGLLGWFLASIEWAELWAALLRVSLGWVVLAATIILSEWVVRGLRWAVLIRPLDPEIPLWPLVSATLVGAALNTLVPLRGGDLVRPALLARERNMPYATAFSTTIVERLLDIFGILCIVGIMVLLLPAADEGELMTSLRYWGKVMAGAGIACVIGCILLATRRARDIVGRWTEPLPDALRDRLLSAFDQLIVGLAVAGHPLRLLLATAVTFVIWFQELLAILCIFYAFDLHLPVSAALFVEGALALSIALPQAPGYLGVFHVVMERAMALWDAPAGVAAASALLFWAVSFVPVTVWGLVEAYRQGLGLTHQREHLFESLEAKVQEGD